MALYTVTDTELTSIANAIRAKGGTSASLVYPSGFISAIGDIPSGCGGVTENSIIDRSITAYENSTISLIGENAFASCYYLESVSLFSCTAISTNAFYRCSSLKTVYIPNVAHIGDSGFDHCLALSEFNAPLCTDLGIYAFYSCSKLETVSLPLIQDIGSYAFQYCSSLQYISASNCSQIYSNAFNSCYALSWASFDTVLSIGNSAFRNCRNLISLYLLGSSVAFLVSSAAFSSSPIGGYTTVAGQYGRIFVRSSLLTSWKSASGWSVLSSRFAGLTDAEIADLDVGNRIVTFSIDQNQNLNCVNINEFIEWGDNGLPVTFYDSYNDFTFVFDDYLDSTGTGEIGFYFDLLKGGELDYSFSKTIGGRTINYTLSSFMDGDNLLVWMNYS